MAEAKLGVPLELAIVTLQNRHDMLAMLQTETGEGGFALQRIPQHGVEEPGIVVVGD